jgi:putative hemolysin
VLPIGAYDPVWLAVAVAFLIPTLLVAICRRALDRASRKALLERVPESQEKRWESSLSHKDDYEETLKGMNFVLRLTLVLVLAFARFLWLEGKGWYEGPSLGTEAVNLLVLAAEVLVLTWLFLELLPAIIARAWPEACVLRLLPLIERAHHLLSPLRRLFDRISRLGAFFLGGQRERTSADIVEEEILSAVEEGEREGLLESRDIDMIESIIDFSDVEVSEVMTPRTEMVCLDLTEPLDANIARAIECGHSRIPVCRGNKDTIIGLLYVKDLLKYLDRKQDIDLSTVARKPHFVPLTKKIGELLQEFKTHRRHIAIVRDEFGGTAGLVTIEDIIEEIVGDISDEYEEIEAAPIRRLSERLVEVDASVHIDDLNDELGLEIPEEETYDTVGGFLFASMGKLPAKGDSLELDGLRFEVTEADDRRVLRLRIHLPEPEESAGREPAGKQEQT